MPMCVCRPMLRCCRGPIKTRCSKTSWPVLKEPNRYWRKNWRGCNRYHKYGCGLVDHTSICTCILYSNLSLSLSLSLSLPPQEYTQSADTHSDLQCQLQTANDAYDHIEQEKQALLSQLDALSQDIAEKDQELDQTHEVIAKFKESLERAQDVLRQTAKERDMIVAEKVCWYCKTCML